jgi:ParB family transcriptional regulator, chromosome partitioning protein
MTATELIEVRLASLKSHPNNPRQHIGDVTELADSIKAHGVLEPLIAVKQGELGDYLVIAGHRRLAAAKQAGLKNVPVLVRHDLDSKAAQIEAMVIENVQRTDLTPVEEGQAYKQLLAFPGYTQAKIAKTTGRSKASIKSRLAITKLPAKAAAKLENGQATLADAEALAAWIDTPEYTDLAAAFGTTNFAWALANAKRKVQLRKDNAALIAKIEAAGGVIDDYPKNSQGARRVAWLDLGLDDDDLDEAAEFFHAKTCEHHVWWRDTYTGRPNGYCTNPAEHDTTAAGDDDDTPDPERDAEITAAMARREALTAARDARETWIRDNLTGDNVKPNKALLTGMLRLAVTGWCMDTLSSLNIDAMPASIRPPVNEDGRTPSWEDVDTHIRSVVPSLTLEQLVQLVFISDAHDAVLINNHEWKPSADQRAVYEELVRLGYQPSDVELQAAKDADRTAAAESGSNAA